MSDDLKRMLADSLSKPEDLEQLRYQTSINWNVRTGGDRRAKQNLLNKNYQHIIDILKLRGYTVEVITDEWSDVWLKISTN